MPDDLYWAGRLTLISRHADLETYDRTFGAYFGALDLPPADTYEPHDHTGEEEQSEFVPPGDPTDQPATAETSLASMVEVLREKSFSTYSEADLQLLVVACSRISVASRRSRRHRAARAGQPDLRRTLRASLRLGGEQAQRAWRVRGERPRRVVVLLDVSGSMTSYSRALLHFAYASVRTQRHWEVFCFATRLSRLTRLFDTTSPDEALARASAEVGDFDGGTRIGACVGQFLREHGHRGMARGAVVIICSDGLEIDDPKNLGLQMQHLARLAHRVVWLNPLKEDPAYEPLARGMRAALPAIDLFASGHNLASLEVLADMLTALL